MHFGRKHKGGWQSVLPDWDTFDAFPCKSKKGIVTTTIVFSDPKKLAEVRVARLRSRGELTKAGIKARLKNRVRIGKRKLTVHPVSRC